MLGRARAHRQRDNSGYPGGAVLLHLSSIVAIFIRVDVFKPKSALGTRVALHRLDRTLVSPGSDFAGYVTMNWAEALEGGVDSKLAANRFVSGALRRIRIRTKLKKLMWMEGAVAMAQRSVAREMEEMVPSRD